MRCPALWAAFFRPPFLSEKRTPISKTLFRRNYLHFAAAGNFCCTSPDPRGGAFLRAPGSGGDLCTRECRELLVKGVPGTNCITPTPSMSHDRKRLQQTVPADPCLPLPTSLSTPPRSSALNWKSTQNTGTFCHYCRKARSARTRHPPAPNLPSYPALGNSLPPLSPFKSKKSSPWATWGRPAWFGDTVVGSRGTARVRAEPGPETRQLPGNRGRGGR